MPTSRRDNGSRHPVFSSDGTRLAFESEATNLTTTPDPHVCSTVLDSWSCTDTFVHDLTTGVTTLVSVGADGSAGNGTSVAPAFSPDGNAITFWTDATNVLPVGAGGLVERDLVAGSTTLLVQGGGGAPVYALSGAVVLFSAYSPPVGTPDEYPPAGVFSVDRASGAVELLSPLVVSSITPGRTRIRGITRQHRRAVHEQPCRRRHPGWERAARVA